MSSAVKSVPSESNEDATFESIEKENARRRLVLTERAKNSRLGRELIGYCIFLIIFTVVTVSPADDPNLEGLNFAATRLLLEEDNLLFNNNVSFTGPKFVDLASVDDIWSWLRGPFLHALYMSDWYSGTPWSVGDQGLVAGANLIVGAVTIRQKRVQSASCTIPTQFLGADNLNDCLADYDPSVEDTSVYGPYYTEPQWASAYAYSSNWPAFPGGIKYYSRGGYGLVLPGRGCVQAKVSVPCISMADRMMIDLQQTGWIDVRTRALVAEVTLYNPPINAFVLVQAVIELPATGGVSPYPIVRTAKLIRYATTQDYGLLGLEISLLLLILIDVIEKVVFYRSYSRSPRDDGWDLYDLVFHFLFYILMILRLNVVVKFDQIKYDPTIRAYYDFPMVFYWHDQAEGLAAFLSWMIWTRSYKFMWHLSWTGRILETLWRATAPLIGLGLTGFLALIAFAHAGLLAFGTQIHDLRTLGVSIMSCYRFIFSGMPYDQFQKAGEFLGPLYYIMFKVWMVLILTRFFVAILVDAYHEVMEEHRYRWTLSFPPIEALVDDVRDWWRRTTAGGVSDEARPEPGEPVTLSGASPQEVAAKAKLVEKGMGEMDAKDMYEVLKARVNAMQGHVDQRLSNLEKMFVTTVAPLVETMDLLVKQQTENAAIAAVRAVKK